MSDTKQMKARHQQEVTDFLARAAIQALPSYLDADRSENIFTRPSHDFELCHELAILLGVREQMIERFRVLREEDRQR